MSRNLINRWTLLGLGLVLMLGSRTVLGQGFTINFDEYGNGSVQLSSGGVIPLQSLGNITDPIDPGSGIKPLAYNLVATIPGIVPFAGDINLAEPQNPTTISDVLRWTQGLLLVYSDLPEPGEIPVPLADVGLPSFNQTPVLNLIETGPETGPNGMFGYVPLPANPGLYPVPPGPVTYNFTSDYAVPEPSTIGVVALIGSALLLRRRRHVVR